MGGVDLAGLLSNPGFMNMVRTMIILCSAMQHILKTMNNSST